MNDSTMGISYLILIIIVLLIAFILAVPPEVRVTILGG